MESPPGSEALKTMPNVLAVVTPPAASVWGPICALPVCMSAVLPEHTPVRLTVLPICVEVLPTHPASVDEDPWLERVKSVGSVPKPVPDTKTGDVRIKLAKLD